VSWCDERTVRATFLARLVTTAEQRTGEQPRAVRLCGARVVGALRVSGLTLAGPLEISLRTDADEATDALTASGFYFGGMRRHDRLGGLIHAYYRDAA
jgi:hypothetical protein